MLKRRRRAMQRSRPIEKKRPPSGLLWLLGLAAALAAAGIWIRAAVEAQRPKGSDEEQIRRMLYEGERAAEQRNAGGVSHFISADYDDGTLRAAQVRYEIGRYLQSEQSLEITIPSESVQPVIDPGGRTGTVMFRMSVGHRGANGSGS